jgi:Ca2+/Na+ antiporter
MLGLDVAMLALATVVLLGAAWSGRVGRWEGVAMLILYTAYIVWLVLR